MRPRLSEPSPDLARRLLTEVGFSGRLVCYRLHPRAGAIETPVYGFEELAGLLAEPYPQVDLAELARWLEETMGDTELAASIRSLEERDMKGPPRLKELRALVWLRLAQAGKAQELV